MKYSKNAFLKDIYGEPIKHKMQTDQDGVKVIAPESTPFSDVNATSAVKATSAPELVFCHDALIDILLHAGSKIRPSEEEKYTRAKIAVRIATSTDTFELRDSEAKLLRGLVGFSCDPLPMFHLWNYLDNPINKENVISIDAKDPQLFQQSV